MFGFGVCTLSRPDFGVKARKSSAKLGKTAVKKSALHQCKGLDLEIECHSKPVCTKKIRFSSPDTPNVHP